MLKNTKLKIVKSYTGEYRFNIPKKLIRIKALWMFSEEALKQRRANTAVMNKNKAKTTERIVETGDDD